MRSRLFPLLVPWLLALLLTLASTFVRGEVAVLRPEIMGCEQGCMAAGRGWPLAYVVDGMDTSPVGSADLLGVVLGVDDLLAGPLVIDFALWTVVAWTTAMLWRRRRAGRRRQDGRRR